MRLNKIGNKIMLLVILPTLLSVFVSILIASYNIENQGKAAIQEKSLAILHRTEHVRDYVATQGGLPATIVDAIVKYPQGNLPDTLKERIKKQVPIIAAWTVSMADADKDNYTFKISSLNPRIPDNKATPIEVEQMHKLKSENLEYLTVEDEKTEVLRIMSPVYLKKSDGCLTCHGAPETSPFCNGKDILGYAMENMKDGDLKGMFTIETNLKPLNSKINATILNIVIWGGIVAGIGIFVALLFSRKIILRIKKLKHIGEEIIKGNYKVRLIADSEDELGELANSLNDMIVSFSKGVDYVQKIASGDLTSDTIISIENLSPLEKAMMTMEIKLNEVVTSIHKTTIEISESSEIMNQRAGLIANGANRQAASTEEVSASMEEMVSNIDQNTENAFRAENIAVNAAKSITEGNESFRVTVEAMKEIASKISVIGQIAARTDILAINAAIEAARSGEHGKGFAVVATEIRKLAESSKQAAERISSLVKTGVDVAETAGKKLAVITPEVLQTSELLQQIANAGTEQNTGANQINDAIQELTKVIQQNTEAADHMSFEALNLNQKAEKLKDAMTYFRIDSLDSDIEKIKTENFSKKNYKYSKMQNKPKEQRDAGFEFNIDDAYDDKNFQRF